MMTMKFKNILMALGLGSMLMTSCTLDEEVYTFISGEDLSADGEYELLVNGAYQPLAWMFEWGSYDSATNYDNDYQTGPGWAFKETGTGNFYNNGSINNVFAYYSTAIHRANYHYYLIDKMTNVPEKAKNNALGELRFLKAWSEFELVRRFGGIPLFKTSIGEGNSSYQPRASVKEVYEDIIANLKEAETLLMPRTDSDYKKGHVFRASAKSLLALVYATIGSASMESGKVMVKGGPGKVTNPDGTESALMPQEIWHNKIRLPGYEEFNSQEYYKLAKEKAAEVIAEGECVLASSQKELWKIDNKNGPEFLFTLQTYPEGDNLAGNYISESYYGYGMRISMKRNALLKAYEAQVEESDASKKDIVEKKYEEAYTAYLEALDKYVLDTIYKKVKNETATKLESMALSQYYGIVQLKQSEYNEYKYRKQKYLLELDRETVINSNKQKVIDRYQEFYVSKQDSLYKGILKNYSVKLADNTNVYDSSKEWIYIKIFDTLEDYIKNILPLKINDPKLEKVVKEYEKYEKFSVGKLDARDNIEKNMILLGISRNLFTHSLPLVVAEQCYMKLLKDARCLVQDTKIAAKREKAYTMLLNLIEDFNIRLLATKVYWDNPKDREQFKRFHDKYKDIEKLKEIDFIEYVKQKEILFIKEDMSKIKNEKTDYTRLIKYYKRRLVDYGVMKEIRDYKTQNGKYKRDKVSSRINETISA